MKKRKILFGSILVLLSVGLISGCGKSSKTLSSSDIITFWNPFTGPDGKNMKKMVDDYNKTNPKIKIKNVSFKESDMYTKIPTVVNSGKNIPDLTIVHAERIKLYKDNDMLVSYDDLLDQYPEINAANYVPEAWKLGEINDMRYSIPLDIHTTGMYYNKSLVKKYAPNALNDGIITFDEIKDAAQKAKKDKISGLGVTWMKPLYLSLLAQDGGKLTENGNTPTLNTKAAKDAFTTWNNLFKEGVTTKDGEDPAQLFLSQKLIFYPEGIWMQNSLADAKFDWGLTFSPQKSSDITKAVSWSSSHQFVMFKSSERTKSKTKGILKFLNWIRTNSGQWAKAGQNPASLNILKDKEYLKMPQSFFISNSDAQKTLKVFDYKYNGYVAEYLDAHANDAVFGKVSVDKTTANMQKEVSDKIEKDKSSK